MKKTNTSQHIKCDCCGSYEPVCAVCGKLLDTKCKIICDDEPYEKCSGEHYHLKCYKIKEDLKDEN